MKVPSKSLGQIISESARGQHDAWPTDLAYPTRGLHEERFKAGDKQRVLWQIYDSAVEGTTIPSWAANAFCNSLIRVVTCQKTWQQEFGDVPAKGPKHRQQRYRSTIRKLTKNLIRVGEAVQNYDGPKDEKMWSVLGDRLGLGRAVMKDYWRRYKLAHGL